MRIFITTIYGYWGNFHPSALFKPSNTMVAGGETAMVNSATQLAKHGHEVFLFYDTARPGEYKGVNYLPKAMAKDMVTKLKGDILISWEDLTPIGWNHKCDLTVLSMQTNSMLCGPLYYCIDYYQVVSESQKRGLLYNGPAPDISISHFPNVEDKFVIFPNGVNLERYAQKVDRDSYRIIYCSSPDRGLHHLLALWPDIKKAVPQASLYVFYNVQQWIDSIQKLADEGTQVITTERAWQVRDLLKATEGMDVHVPGPVGQWQLAQEQLKSSLMVYPCDPVDQFTEGFCAHPNTPILTPQGLKTIEHVAEGEQVIGLDGSWHEVTAQYKRQYSGKLLVLRVGGWPQPLLLTPEHPVLRGWGGDTHRKWVPAKERPRFIYAPVPRDVPAPEVLNIIDYDPMPNRKALAQPSLTEGYWSFPNQKICRVPAEIPISPELCELLGWYLAEGTASLSTSTTIFSLGSREIINIERIQELCKTLFHLSTGFFTHEGKAQVKIHSKLIAGMFHSLCGYGAHNKHLPSWFLGLDQECRQALLIGLFRGDGNIRRSKTKTKGGSLSAQIVLTTVSKELAYGTRLLLFQERCRVSGYFSAKRNSWEVMTSVKQAPWLAWALGCEVPYPNDLHSRYNRFRYKDGLVKLTAHWSEQPYDGLVYDLSVPTSKSYLAGPTLIHNSIAILECLTAGTPVITTDADAFPELWSETTVQIPRPIRSKEQIWVDTIQRLFTNKAEWKEQSKRGQAKAKTLTWDKIGVGYEQWLQEALKKKREEL